MSHFSYKNEVKKGVLQQILRLQRMSYFLNDLFYCR